MIRYPADVYSDVRIEEVAETSIRLVSGNLEEARNRSYCAAFVRVFDGSRWYYGSLCDVSGVEEKLRELAILSRRCGDISTHPIVGKLQVNEGTFLTLEACALPLVSLEEKLDLVRRYTPLFEGHEHVKTWSAVYSDRREVKTFQSCLGADVTFDSQRAGFQLALSMAHDGAVHDDTFTRTSARFADLEGREEEVGEWVDKVDEFLERSRPVTPGNYPVILSPMAAGFFAHECFGHKSEADFFLGDASARKDWALGRAVGSPLLTIIDDGNEVGSGFVPFDDEGTRAERTYILRDGVLTGRLHNSVTAAALGEALTGNGRAVDFRFEPIPRQSTTYINPGKLSRRKLFSAIDDGIYVETVKHGSGMSTFTLAPCRAYAITDGAIGRPVNVAVVSGNVLEALGNVDGLSTELEIYSFVGGGCGKFQQSNLPIAFGGPYVRVRNLDVR